MSSRVLTIGYLRNHRLLHQIFRDIWITTMRCFGFKYLILHRSKAWSFVELAYNCRWFLCAWLSDTFLAAQEVASSTVYICLWSNRSSFVCIHPVFSKGQYSRMNASNHLCKTVYEKAFTMNWWTVPRFSAEKKACQNQRQIRKNFYAW